MTAHIRHVAGTDRPVVYHHCGQRMQHLETYQLAGGDASDWWCNRCCAAEELRGLMSLEPGFLVDRVIPVAGVVRFGASEPEFSGSGG